MIRFSIWLLLATPFFLTSQQTHAQSTVRFGIQAGVGGGGMSDATLISSNRSERLRPTNGFHAPLSLQVSFRPDSTYAVNTGIESTYRQFRLTYEREFFDNGVHGEFWSLSIPVMANFRFRPFDVIPLRVTASAGGSIDFFDPNFESGGLFGVTFIDSTGTIPPGNPPETATASKYRTARPVSASARFQGGIEYDIGNAGSLEFGALVSFGLQTIAEGDFKVYPGQTLNIGDLADWEEILASQTPDAEYTWESNGSYGAFYIRYYLPDFL